MVRGSGGRVREREKTRRDDVPQNNNDENIMAKKIASLVSPRVAANQWRKSTAAAANQSGERGLLYLQLGLVMSPTSDLNHGPSPAGCGAQKGDGRRVYRYVDDIRRERREKVESLGPLCPPSLAASRISSSSVQCNGLHDEPPPRRLHAAPAHFLPLTGCQYSNNDALDKIQTEPRISQKASLGQK